MKWLTVVASPAMDRILSASIRWLLAHSGLGRRIEDFDCSSSYAQKSSAEATAVAITMVIDETQVCGTGLSVLDTGGASCSSFSGFELAVALGSAVLDSHLPEVPGRFPMISLLPPISPLPSHPTPTCQALAPFLHGYKRVDLRCPRSRDDRMQWRGLGKKAFVTS
ncbi:hypothetical protein K449DRAFT_429180 [Hypoxylon sp. EC38]|nr:hypothetical protein K449DRAFT_429180 [Hypoxylon sp. EC38]